MHFPQKTSAFSPQAAPRKAGVDWSIHSIGAYAPGTGKAGSVWFRRLFVALVLVFAVVNAGCSREAPEAALRARIDAMQVAAEARDSAAVAEVLSEEFVGPEGMDRDGFRRYLAVVWLRNREVGVQLGPLDVTMAGETGATVDFTAAVRGGEGWMPDRAQVYRVKTGWRVEDGEWRLVSARWEPSL